MTILNLLLIALLIALTGFFVAIEFAIVKVRPSRIDQLITEGKKGAVSAKKVVNHLDEYLSACQLGITVTALGLGWLGEPTVEKLIHPLLSVLNINEYIAHLISFIIAFASVTFLHVVVGELAPKTVAIHKAEAVALLLAAPIIGFTKVMRPFIWALNGSARLLVGIFGLKPESEKELAHSEEELRLLLAESYRRGEINQNELTYVNNIFEFDERVAKEIMVPRTEMSTFSISDSIDEVMDKIGMESYSRYPITDGDKDNIVGLLNVKVFLTSKVIDKSHNEEISLSSFVKPVMKVIETIPIHDLLVRMQKERSQMAILVDEYGGTSGLVTVEDIIEEIVGEVRDEFDNDEVAQIQKVKENHYLLDGKVLIEDVNSLLGTNITGERIDTIGGWFLTQNFDVDIGTEAKVDGYLFKVREAVGHHILYLDVKKMVG
jgi:CBS domain containing-hemolysin-like protein